MSEMVLAMPFLVLILLLLFFFGRGLVRAQRVAVMDRYEAWRQASADAPGPHAQIDDGHTLLNQTFYGGNADAIDYDGADLFPPDAPRELIAEAAAFATRAKTVELVNDVYDQFARGRSVRFRARHDEAIKAIRDMDLVRPVASRHTRLGHDWRFANGWRRDSDGEWEPRTGGTSMLGPLRDVFYPAFDDQLESLASNNSLARMLRGMYLNEPAYRGPEVWRP
jgi:hypothetical protein